MNSLSCNSPTLLLVGLGNPSKEYVKTRHNAGFIVADDIVRCYDLSSSGSKFDAEFFTGEINGRKVFLLKPLTFMNNSGVSVQKAVRFYKIPLEDIIVIHDDIDLKLGKVKVKIGGGSGGHNGIKSIDSHIGNEYKRIRIGIGRPRENTISHVLGKFTDEEREVIAEVVTSVSHNLPLLLDGNTAQC